MKRIKRRIVRLDPIADKFNRRTRAIILKALKTRLPKGRAASLAGIGYPVLRSWLELGIELQGDKTKPINSVFVSFRRKVNAIEAQHEVQSLRRIELAAKGGHRILETKVRVKSLGSIKEKEITKIKKVMAPIWQADAWYLERTKRATYGREAAEQVNDRTPEEDAAAIKEAADTLFASVPLEAEGE